MLAAGTAQPSHSLFATCQSVPSLPWLPFPLQDGESARLHVGHLTRNVGEEHVREIFATFGKLKTVELAIDRMVNLPRWGAGITTKH